MGKLPQGRFKLVNASLSSFRGAANGPAQSAARWREPGIHNHDWGLWIPGLRPKRRIPE
jgi:hypothetical protein